MVPLGVLVASLAAIAIATLTPVTGSPEKTPLLCVLCGERGLADAILNVALFMPAGWAAARLIDRRIPVVAGGFMLSVTIEVVQAMIGGRDPALGDILFNTMGTGVGAVLGGLRRAPGSGPAWALSLLVISVPATTAFLFQPAPPESEWYGQWTADLGHLHPYDGRVVSARLGPAPVPPGRLPAKVHQMLRLGAPLRVEMEAGPAPRAISPVLSIYDDAQREVVLLGVDQSHVVLRYRVRAAAVKLGQPDLRLFDAMRSVGTGDRVYLEADLSGGVCLRRGPVSRCGLAPPSGRGWALLYFFDDAGPAVRAGLDLVWVAGLAVLLGLVWSNPSHAAAWGAVLATGLVVGDLSLGLGTPALAPLAGVLLGTAAGVRLRWVALDRRGRWPVLRPHSLPKEE